MKRSALKRTPARRPMSPLDFSEFARGVYELRGDACWACRTNPGERWKCHDRSNGIVDFHHVIPQATIRRELASDGHDDGMIRDALSDARNGVCLHRWHHDQVTHAMCRIEIPDSAWAFASEWNLVYVLERLEERAA